MLSGRLLAVYGLPWLGGSHRSQAQKSGRMFWLVLGLLAVANNLFLKNYSEDHDIMNLFTKGDKE